MNPFERRVIHSALSENKDVKTESQGSEPNRYIVIIPNNLKPYGKNDKKGRFDKNGGRNKGERDEVKKVDKKPLGFGTFLGNSNK